MLFSVDWPFQPDSSLYRQHDQGGRNIYNYYTILAKLTLVPDHTGTGLDNTPSADAKLRPIDAIIRSLPLSYGEPLHSTNRMASIRNCPRSQGRPEDDVEVLFAGTRTNTHTAYQTGWNAWRKLCLRRCGDSLYTSIGEILKFLTETFMAGKNYSFSNLFHSMISSTLNLVQDG